MVESFGLTGVLALLIGLYFVAAGGSLILSPGRALTMMGNLGEQPALTYVAGIVVLAIGGTILAVHYDFSSLLAGFVTLVGWAALIEALLLLAAGQWFIGLFAGINWSDLTIRGCGVATVGLGVVLIVAGVG